MRAQELIVNGTFADGLNNWTQASWAGGSSFGLNANGPTDTSAASGNYAYAGGGTYNLLQQSISGVTNGGVYRLTFMVGSKSGEASTYGLLSLFDGLAGNYNSASFDYRPSSAAFGTYTVDFTARGATDLWLRNDGGGYAAYDNVSVTQIGGVTNALNYTSASGYTEITSALSGSGKVTVNAGSGGLTLVGANTYSGGTEVTGGTLFVTGSGTLGDAAGAVTVNNSVLDLRNQQTRTGTITITNTGFILSGNGTGSLVNNGGALQFGGGSIELPLSGTGGMNVTGGGRVTSSNSYTGATTISGTLGWFGTDSFYLNNANGLGAASGDLTVSGGTFDLANNTLTRSGNITITGGTVNNGTISKSGTNYDIQGGVINAALAGTAGLTKSGAGNAAIYGANTYSGGTVINAGTLVVGSAGGLGDAAGTVTVNSGAGLYVDSGLTISRTGNLTVDGGTLSGDNSNLGTISISGGGNFIANNGAALAVKLGGTGGLTVGGTGDTYLWASNSYTGSTVINSGQLILGGNGAISESSAVQIDSGAAFLLTGAFAPNNINRTIAGLTGAGVLWGAGGTVTVNKASGTDTFTGDIQSGQGLIKSGSGTLVLGGASSYTGATTVSAGTLLIANGSALGSTAAGTTVASGAQLRLNATNSGFTIGDESLTISGQGVTTGGALRNAAGNNTLQGKVTLAANATIGAAGGTSLTLDVASGNAIEASDFNLTFDGAGTNAVNDAISLGTGGLTKIGSGAAILAASNSYSGLTDIRVGSLTLSGNGRLGTNAVTISNGASLNLATAQTYVMANDISGGGQILNNNNSETRLTGAVTSTGGLTINSGVVRIGNGGTAGSFTGDTVLAGGTLAFDRSDTFTYAGQISGSGTLSKVSGGTVYLGGNSTNFSGTMTIYAGTARIGDGATSGLFSGNTAVNASGTLAFDRTDSSTYGGAISGAGSVVKVNTGAITLTGSNNYSGTTTLFTGTVVADNADALGTGNITFATGGGNTGTIRYTAASAGTDWASRIKDSSGTVRLDTDTNSVTLAGAIDSSNIGGLAKSGDGTLTLGGSNSYGGGTFLSQGTLRLENTAAAGTGTITQTTNNSTLQINTSGTVANAMSIFNIRTLQTVTLSGNKTLNNATYTVDSGTTTTESGVLSGTGGITKQGTGTLVVTASNSFTGAVDVQAGLLNLNSATGGAAASTASVTVATNATLLLSASDQLNNSASVTLSGGTIQRGAGVSEAFGDLTITAASFLDFGTGGLASGGYEFRFENYSNTGSALVTVQNFLPGSRLQFLSSSFGTNNLAQFTFSNDYTTGTSGSYFTITAIPEPSTYVAAAGLLALLLWSSRRRASRSLSE